MTETNRRILTAIAAGCHTPEQITAAVWPRAIDQRRAVKSMVAKLARMEERDGVVVERLGKWFAVEGVDT